MTGSADPVQSRGSEAPPGPARNFRMALIMLLLLPCFVSVSLNHPSSLLVRLCVRKRREREKPKSWLTSPFLWLQSVLVPGSDTDASTEPQRETRRGESCLRAAVE